MLEDLDEPVAPDVLPADPLGTAMAAFLFHGPSRCQSRKKWENDVMNCVIFCLKKERVDWTCFKIHELKKL